MQRIESGSAPKALIADDETVIARMWEIIFSQLGFQVAVCFDGREALRKARTWHPDLFVTDMAMPRMDGVQAALRVHKLLPGCAIVILSASSEGSNEVNLIRQHHIEYIQKPVPPGVLIERLETLLHVSVLPPKIGVRSVSIPDFSQRRTG